MRVPKAGGNSWGEGGEERIYQVKPADAAFLGFRCSLSVDDLVTGARREKEEGQGLRLQ